MQSTINEDVRRKARVLWDYHHLDLGLHAVDFVLALGSHDERVGTHAARLVLMDLAPLLVASGGYGKVTRITCGVAEAVRFAEIAKALGVPPSKILIEDTATNTGENVTRTRDLLRSAGITVSSGILVTKPYMRRRAYATAAKQWPEITWLVSSPPLSFEEYPDAEVSEERMIELMVGDLQRMKVYAETGFQVPQDVPEDVWRCYEDLVRCGFDRHVIGPKK